PGRGARAPCMAPCAHPLPPRSRAALHRTSGGLMTSVGRMVAATVAVMVTVAACTPAGSPSESASAAASKQPPAAAQATPTRTPHAPADQPPIVQTSDVRMPLALEDAVVVDPGWTDVPHELDGVLIGAIAHDGLVHFT